MEYISNIENEVRENIELVGAEIISTDSFLISQSIEKTKMYICNRTNQDKVPLGLKYVWIYRSVGEFLHFKVSLGQMNNIEKINFSPMAKEISEGLVKISYKDSKSTGDVFMEWVSELMKVGEDEFYKYRRLVW